jgi:hypothetical protein
VANGDTERPLRSLVYVSDAKLSQIVDSLDKGTQRAIAAQLTVDLKVLGLTLSSTSPDRSLRNRSRIARLAVAERYLRQQSQIGDVSSGGGWIEGQIDMGWKPLQDGKTVLFCGYAGSLLVALTGSAGNLLGSQAAEGQVGSYPATVREAISPGTDIGHFWRDLAAMAPEVCMMPQQVRFLARVLDRRQSDGDPAGAAAVLATPLFVELADEPPSIGPYQVQRRLGSGAMGLVYLVRDRNGRDRALKVIRPEHAQDAGFLRRFADEADSARRIRNPFVARVVDAAANTGNPYLVTEYVPGDTLFRKVTRDGPLPIRKAARAGRGIASALAAIHEAGIVHRDLTPSNVILSPEGPKVIDFGIARPAARAPEQPAGEMHLGTPGYMSPEQARGEEPASPSDVFSWAATMVFATTGHPPFAGASRDDVFREIQDGEPDLTGVPAQFREIITAALAKDPAARPTADDLVRRTRARDRPRALVAVGLALVVLAIVAVIALTGSGGGTPAAAPPSGTGAAARPAAGSTSAASATTANPGPSTPVVYTYDQTAGADCPKTGDTQIYKDEPHHSTHPWTSATGANWSAVTCGNTLLFTQPTTHQNANRWINDYSWTFVNVPKGNQCTFHIYIADSPYSEYTANYFWTTGGTVQIDTHTFTIDQAMWQGTWFNYVPLTFPTGRALLMMTDSRTGGPTDTMTASVVRLTCT